MLLSGASDMRLLLALLLTLPASSLACSMKVTWIPPTTYTDGSPLPLTDIVRYELRCQHELVPKVILKYPKAGLKGYNLSSEKFVVGPYSCIMRTHALRDKVALVSDPSNVARFVCQ